MTTAMPKLGSGVSAALTRLDTFRPTEAAVLRREITRLRRIIANHHHTAPDILPQDLTDLASRLDQTRAHYPGNVPTRAYADAVAAAGWAPTKGN